MSRRHAAAVALLVLAACTGGHRIVGGTPGPGYSETLAREVTGGRQPIEIVGAPPDGSAPAAVAAALRAPARFSPTVFEPVLPGAGGRRIVLEFGSSFRSARSCRAPRPGAAASQGLVVTASLCIGDRLANAASLTAPNLEGPSSPDFANAMALLLSELLPLDQKPFRILR